MKIWNLEGLSNERHLIVHKSPLLSLFTNKSGDAYLFWWIDATAGGDRWLVAQVTPHQLALYKNQTITLREVYLSADNCAYAETNSEGEVMAAASIPITSVPDDQMPEDSLWQQ